MAFHVMRDVRKTRNNKSRRAGELGAGVARAFVCALVVCLMSGFASRAAAQAVVQVGNIAGGDPYTAGNFFTVDVAVTSNTQAPVQAYAFRIHYDSNYVLLTGVADVDLGAVAAVSGATGGGGADTWRDVLTPGNLGNSLYNLTVLRLTFFVTATPTGPYNIWLEDDPSNIGLVDTSFLAIPHTFDNSGVSPMPGAPTPSVSPTPTPTPIVSPSASPSAPPSPSVPPSPSASPTPPPQVSPTPTPIPTPTPTPVMSLTPTPTPNPTPPISVTPTPSPTPSPTPPSDLTAETVSRRRVDLVWTDNSLVEDGFAIERRRQGLASWSIVGAAPADASSFTDDLAGPGIAYEYRVGAHNNVGVAYSNIASATTLCAKPGLDVLDVSQHTTPTMEYRLTAEWDVTWRNGVCPPDRIEVWTAELPSTDFAMVPQIMPPYPWPFGCDNPVNPAPPTESCYVNLSTVDRAAPDAPGLAGSLPIVGGVSHTKSVDVAFVEPPDNGTTYLQFVKAIDGAGNESGIDFNDGQFEDELPGTPLPSGAFRQIGGVGAAFISDEVGSCGMGWRSLCLQSAPTTDVVEVRHGLGANILPGLDQGGFHLSACQRATTDGARMRVEYRQDGTGWMPWAEATGTGGDVWTTVSLYFNLPPNFAGLRLVLDNAGNNVLGAGAKVFWDDVSLQQVHAAEVLSEVTSYEAFFSNSPNPLDGPTTGQSVEIVPAAVAGLSKTGLPDGQWYAHVRAVDHEGNNSDWSTFGPWTLAAWPDLNVAVDDNDTTATPCDLIVYEVFYGNGPIVDAIDAVVSVIVPEHTRFDETASAPGWTPITGHEAGDLVELDLGALAADANGAAFFVVQARPVPGTDAVVTTLTATIEDRGQTSPATDDRNLADNLDIETSVIGGVEPPCCVEPTSPVVYVDLAWDGATTGDLVDGRVFGVEAFADIQEAVDAVPAGGTVVIAAGVYPIAAPIDLDHSVHLLGEAAGGTVLQGTGAPHDGVRMTKTCEATTLTCLTVADFGGNGVVLVTEIASSSLAIERCSIIENGVQGVFIDQEIASLWIADSLIAGNGYHGVNLSEQFNIGLIERCRILNNGYAGVHVKKNGSALTLIDCDIVGNSNYGLRAVDNAPLTAIRCNIHGNTAGGAKGEIGGVFAVDCWWGSYTGPGATDGGGRTGDIVKDNVVYIPWSLGQWRVNSDADAFDDDAGNDANDDNDPYPDALEVVMGTDPLTPDAPPTPTPTPSPTPPVSPTPTPTPPVSPTAPPSPTPPISPTPTLTPPVSPTPTPPVSLTPTPTPAPTPTGLPDLTIAADDGGGMYMPCDVVLYEIAYGNLAGGLAASPEITAWVPEYGTFDAGASAPGWNATAGVDAGSPITMSLGSLVAGDAGMTTFAVQLGPIPGPDAVVTTLTASIADLAQANPATDDLNPADNVTMDETDVSGVEPPCCEPPMTPVVYVNLAWAGASPGDVVDPFGHVFGLDAFADIQAGVDALPLGGSVVIAAGVYHQTFSVQIDHPVALMGAGRGQTILDGDGGAYDGISVRPGADMVIISCLTIRDFGLEGIESESTGVGQDVFVEYCAIRNNGGVGLRINRDNSFLYANRTVIRGNGHHGLELEENCSGQVEHCRIRDNGYDGVFVKKNSVLTLADCDVEGNVNYGVRSRGSGHIDAVNCNIAGNLWGGSKGESGGVNAVGCWWGSYAGPGATDGGGRTGDIVKENVAYQPWSLGEHRVNSDGDALRNDATNDDDDDNDGVSDADEVAAGTDPLTAGPPLGPGIFVDQAWTGSAPGAVVGPGLVFGVNAFDNIPDGYDACLPWGTIYIAPGVYAHGSALLVEKPVAFQGSGATSTVVQGGLSDGFRCEAEAMALFGLTVRGFGGAALNIRNDAPGGAYVVVANCRLESNGLYGVLLDKMYNILEITGSLIANNGDDGLKINRSACFALVSRCRIVNNGDYGVDAEDGGTAIEIYESDITGNANYGVRARDGAAGFVTECNIVGNYGGAKENVNAPNNYWGSYAGPGATDPGGRVGQKLKGAVTYMPYALGLFRFDSDGDTIDDALDPDDDNDGVDDATEVANGTDPLTP